MVRNWKTTVGGVLTLLVTGYKIFTTGAIDAQDMAAITGGIGLVLAKDHNVTGGLKPMVEIDTINAALSDVFGQVGSAVVINGKTVNGWFRRSSKRINVNTGSIDVVGPTVELLAVDCGGVIQGTPLAIDGEDFRVARSPDYDGLARTTLYLVKS